MEITVGSKWIYRKTGETVEVTVIRNDKVVDYKFIESFIENYDNYGEFLREFDPASEPVVGVKHEHYHKDTSAYDTMDIYAICKVWNVEPSGCTFAAVKKLLNAGQRGAKDRVTDLEQAIESIESLIKLIKMDM